MQSTNTKIVTIMAVWDEQNMIGLAIASTREITYQYIVIIKKGIDKTRDVIEYCKKLWSLNMVIIESEMKLREARNYAMTISREYADYYLIQDGDEIYFNNSSNYNDVKGILKLIDDGYTFCFTRMIYLHSKLNLTLQNVTELIPHPFFFKNLPDIYFPTNHGDMPSYNSQKLHHKILTYEKATTQLPYKFDVNIKNYRRQWLRDVFTPWHDTSNVPTIEEFATLNHPDMKWHRKKNPQITLDEVISISEKRALDILAKMKHHKYYDEKTYVEYPYVIKKFITANKLYGVNDVEADIGLLDEL